MELRIILNLRFAKIFLTNIIIPFFESVQGINETFVILLIFLVLFSWNPHITVILIEKEACGWGKWALY